MAIITGRRPIRPSGVDDGIWLIAEHCWQHDRSRRPHISVVLEYVRLQLDCVAQTTRRSGYERIPEIISIASPISTPPQIGLMFVEPPELPPLPRAAQPQGDRPESRISSILTSLESGSGETSPRRCSTCDRMVIVEVFASRKLITSSSSKMTLSLYSTAKLG